jgi:hypothetical protein
LSHTNCFSMRQPFQGQKFDAKRLKKKSISLFARKQPPILQAAIGRAVHADSWRPRAAL